MMAPPGADRLLLEITGLARDGGGWPPPVPDGLWRGLALAIVVSAGLWAALISGSLVMIQWLS